MAPPDDQILKNLSSAFFWQNLQLLNASGAIYYLVAKFVTNTSGAI